MSEIKSNFRISLDLFELTIFGTNYGIQTVNESSRRCPKVALRYFVPLAAKRFLELFDTVVFFSAKLAFQNSPGTQYCNGLASGQLCGGNEASHLIL